MIPYKSYSNYEVELVIIQPNRLGRLIAVFFVFTSSIESSLRNRVYKLVVVYIIYRDVLTKATETVTKLPVVYIIYVRASPSKAIQIMDII